MNGDKQSDTPRCDKHFAEDIVRDRGEKEITSATLSMLYFAQKLERELRRKRLKEEPLF